MRHLLLFIMALMITSCYQPMTDDDSALESNSKNFIFTVKGQFTSDLKTRANEYLTAEGREMTDLWVLDVVDGRVVQQLHQSPTDPAWGAPQMSLTLGTHHVMFCASRGSAPELDGSVLRWGKVLDTFFTDYEVTVVPTSNGNRAVTLDRIITQLRTTIDDAIPSGMTQLLIEPDVWYNGIDLVTGELIEADGAIMVTMYPEDEGQKGIQVSASWLAPTEEYTTSVTYRAMNGSSVTSTATADDVQFVRNRRTLLHGNMFGGSVAAGVLLSTEWIADYDGGTW